MSESHTALYRKYRPHTFEEVRNQEHIVTVLEGAIKKSIVPHALLFTGSRGTGKTTVARIFARAIGTDDVDVYEIDAASNRGIDDVRELRDAVHTLPFKSPYKVYIIDEVHMLTKEAFNALLKTLEEPPKHVIFILATTEEDKLLPTITSRCQVFRFRTPTRAVLRDTVLSVAKKEGYTFDEGAADIIAIAADGAFRDALGITQKVIMASADKKVDADEVATIVGAPKNKLIMEVVQSLATKDATKGLAAVREAHEAHADMKLFLRLTLERVRTVMLLRNSKEDAAAFLEQYNDEDQDTLRGYASDATCPLNSHMLLRLLDAAEHTGKTFLPQLPLELAIVDLCEQKRA